MECISAKIVSNVIETGPDPYTIKGKGPYVCDQQSPIFVTTLVCAGFFYLLQKEFTYSHVHFEDPQVVIKESPLRSNNHDISIIACNCQEQHDIIHTRKDFRKHVISQGKHGTVDLCLICVGLKVIMLT